MLGATSLATGGSPSMCASLNLLRLLTSTCGYKEVRLMTVQKPQDVAAEPRVRRGRVRWALPAPAGRGVDGASCPRVPAAGRGPPRTCLGVRA